MLTRVVPFVAQKTAKNLDNTAQIMIYASNRILHTPSKEVRTMTRTDFVRTAVFAASCWIGLSMPAAAQGVGAIAGNVTDNSGAVLPGATVTLASPGLIGGNQTASTDERGAYQFTRLVPGRYSIK